MGWGQAIGKIADYIQGRDERRRNQLDSLRREYEKLLKEPQNDKTSKRMSAIMARMRVLEAQAKNK